MSDIDSNATPAEPTATPTGYQRINTKVVMDMTTGDVLNRESYFYSGPLALLEGEPEPVEPAAESSTPDPATPDPSAAAPATPNATAPAATPQVPEGYIHQNSLRGRFDEVRQRAAQEAEARYNEEKAQLQAQLEQYQRQLHAVVGVTPQAEDEVSQIRQQFNELFPGLARLAERYDDIEGLLERAGDLDNQNQHYWSSYGRQQMDRLFETAQADLGAPLNDAQKRYLHASFTGYVSSSPELVQRYSQDPTLVTEFWKEFSDGFIAPVRRNATAQTVTRATAPTVQDTPGSGGKITPSSPPAPKDLDERVGMGWTQFNQSRKG